MKEHSKYKSLRIKWFNWWVHLDWTGSQEMLRDSWTISVDSCHKFVISLKLVLKRAVRLVRDASKVLKKAFFDWLGISDEDSSCVLDDFWAFVYRNKGGFLAPKVLAGYFRQIPVNKRDCSLGFSVGVCFSCMFLCGFELAAV